MKAKEHEEVLKFTKKYLIWMLDKKELNLNDTQKKLLKKEIKVALGSSMNNFNFRTLTGESIREILGEKGDKNETI